MPRIRLEKRAEVNENVEIITGRNLVKPLRKLRPARKHLGICDQSENSISVFVEAYIPLGQSSSYNFKQRSNPGCST